jgi:hypothetical protein
MFLVMQEIPGYRGPSPNTTHISRLRTGLPRLRPVSPVKNLTGARAITNMGRTKDDRRTVHPRGRAPSPEAATEPGIFTEDERIRLTEVMLDESFMDALDRRAQIAAVCAILRRPEDPLRFTCIAIGVFLEGLSSGVASAPAPLPPDALRRIRLPCERQRPQ